MVLYNPNLFAEQMEKDLCVEMFSGPGNKLKRQSQMTKMGWTNTCNLKNIKFFNLFSFYPKWLIYELIHHVSLSIRLNNIKAGHKKTNSTKNCFAEACTTNNSYFRKIAIEKSFFYVGPPKDSEHIFDHWLWSIFHSSLHTLQITFFFMI